MAAVIEVRAVNHFRIILSLALTFAYWPSTSSLGKEQKLVKCKVEDKTLRSVKYRIANMERSTSNGVSTLLIHVSVNPKEFTREFAVLLARNFNPRFCHEERLVIAIYTDHNSAKYLNPSFQNVLDAWRGEYVLDRRTGEEYISFTTIPDYNGNPQARVRINLGAQKSP